MRNWITVLKKVRNLIVKNPDSTLCQAKDITDFIRENFKPKKNTKAFTEDKWIN